MRKLSDYWIAQLIIFVLLLLFPLIALAELEPSKLLPYAHDWLLYTSCLILVSHFVSRRFIKKMLSTGRFYRILIVFSAVIMTAAFLYIPSYLLSFIWYDSEKDRQLLIQFLTSMNVIFSFVWVIGYLAALAARERSQLEETYKKQSLRMLSQQIQPKFLYQSLDQIEHFMDSDLDKACDAVTNLAELLRYKLRAGKEEYVDLYDELIAARYMQSLAEAGDLNLSALDELQPKTIKLPPLLVYNLLFQLNHKVDQPLNVTLEQQLEQWHLCVSGLTHNPRLIKKRMRTQYPDFFAINPGFQYKNNCLTLKIDVANTRFENRKAE